MVRLYEAHGATVRTRLHTHHPVSKAWQSNLLEEERKPVTVARNGIPLQFRPFEIKTLVLK